MRKIVIGIVAPLVASLGLWLGVAGSAAHASARQANVHPATALSAPATASTSTEGTDPSGTGEGAPEADGPGGHQDPDGVDVNYQAGPDVQQ